MKRLGQVFWLFALLLSYLAVSNFETMGYRGGGPLLAFIAVPLDLAAYIFWGPPWRVFID